jgi:hypothetical protein
MAYSHLPNTIKKDRVKGAEEHQSGERELVAFLLCIQGQAEAAPVRIELKPRQRRSNTISG